MRRRLRDNSLTLAFATAFLLTLAGQALVGHAEFNNELLVDSLAPVSLTAYLMSSDFAVDVTENWQSEYLQFFLYIFGTVWLLQRGSPESKKMDRAGPEDDETQRVGAHARDDSPAGRRPKGSARSCSPARWAWSWRRCSSCRGWRSPSCGTAAYNELRLRNLQPPVDWSGYILSADFWGRTFQNWQSELLAVASMAILSVYLRQRGSPESKPVGAPHHATGVEG